MAQTPGDPAGSSGGVETGNLITEQVKQSTQQVVGQSQQVAVQAAQTAQEKAQSLLSSRKDQMTDSLGSMAQALRDTGDTLRSQNQDAVAGVADTAANKIEGIAGYLQQRDLGQIVDETESYARRNPAVFLGGAFILGVGMARFLKSSSQPGRAEGGAGRYTSYVTGRGYGSGADYTTRYEDLPRYGGVTEMYPPDSMGGLRGAGTGIGRDAADDLETAPDMADLGVDDGASGRPY